jgi:hypothetical protein
VAGRVEVGDEILIGDDFAVIDRIRKAQGRKPKAGENLHLVTPDDVIKLNSTDPVRVRRSQRGA